ncbi:hypothetical protein [Dictyobacter arantiisoli]|uniref:Uncharacterized protein n=1 Tax=Dictyobacter arantiisoli TaxID=2014874 RepID=A0A5A5TF74_9CHLR|nr:hypothetical protein [Dictyobacter arantiisoli]GCF09723.1 hypothetical protein KDI_32870 [Dictyobacter arantiisoli]
MVIDDKPQILMDIKKIKGDTVTTLFVKQGKYADAGFSDGFVPDLTVEQIGDTRFITPEQFLHPQASAR